MHRRSRDRFDIFTMLRNKPLHGVVPAAIRTQPDEVVAWWMQFDGGSLDHLAIDAKGKLHVDVSKLARELLGAADRFERYLAADATLLACGPDNMPRSPTARWQRALWARFRPHEEPGADWIKRGEKLGIPS